MKSILFSLFFSLVAVAAFAQSTTYVNGYYKTDGTYVSGHYKTVSNGTNWDNYSTRGNTNTYTGTSGTVPRDYSSQSYSSRAGKTIYTGPRGGKYYINSRGTRTYVPK
jgi:5-enolpyruvylshikimate-3-phosphate synthase